MFIIVKRDDLGIRQLTVVRVVKYPQDAQEQVQKVQVKRQRSRNRLIHT